MVRNPGDFGTIYFMEGCTTTVSAYDITKFEIGAGIVFRLLKGTQVRPSND